MAQENTANPTMRLLVLVAVAIIAFGGGFFVGNYNNSSSDSADKAGSAAIAPTGDVGNDSDSLPIGDSFILGDESALVTIIEFSDFQCPFCARGATTME